MPNDVNIKIREVEINDFEKISLLQSHFNLMPKKKDDFINLIFKQPFTNNQTPKGWVLINAEKIVGFIGNIISCYSYLGKTFFAASGHSFMVLEEYRKHSLLLLLKYTNQKNIDIILNTTSNIEVSEIFSKFKFEKPLHTKYQDSFFWVTNSSAFLNSYFKYKKNNFLIKFFNFLPNLQYLFNRYNIPARVDTNISVLNVFDYRFEDLWIRLKNSTQFLADRSLTALNWHFNEKINSNDIYILVKTKDNGKTITSYSIFMNETNPLFDLKRIRMVDYVSENPSEHEFSEYVKFIIKHAVKNKISMLEIVGFKTEFQLSLKRLKPFKRRLPSWMFYFKVNNKELNNSNFRDNWNCNSFDGDGSL